MNSCFFFSILEQETFSIMVKFFIKSNSKIILFQRPFRTFQHKARLSRPLVNEKNSTLTKHVSPFPLFPRNTMTLLTRRKISISNKGNKKTKETKNKIKRSLENRNHSSHHKEKIRETLCGPKNPIFGKKRSRITKKKISKSLLKKKIEV